MVPVGIYACGSVAAGLELAYARGVVAVTGDPLIIADRVASYTAAPAIEELVKVAPIVVVAWNLRTRFQWGLADYVVMGGGLGGGFALLEAMLRYGASAADAVTSPGGGWIVATGLNAPCIRGLGEPWPGSPPAGSRSRSGWHCGSPACGGRPAPSSLPPAPGLARS